MKTLNEKQKEEIKFILADKLGFDIEEINDESNLRNDLGTDSLDDIELIMEFESHFDIYIKDEDAENVRTVNDIYNLISSIL